MASPAQVLGKRKAAAPGFSVKAAFLGGREAEGGDGHVIPMYCRQNGVKMAHLPDVRRGTGILPVVRSTIPWLQAPASRIRSGNQESVKSRNHLPFSALAE
jgi:hypothetical protein